MAERLRSLGAMLITAPSEHEVLYQMAVRISSAELVPLAGYALSPWMSIRKVGDGTGEDNAEYSIAAGVKAKKTGE